MANPDMSKPGQGGQVQGEGDYVSARKYDEALSAFAKDTAKVERKAKEAEEAMEGPEGQELERARKETAKGDPKRH